jgi:hypothetical protein
MNDTARLVPTDSLKAKLTREEEGADFSDLPFHYFEVSRMLLEWWDSDKDRDP